MHPRRKATTIKKTTIPLPLGMLELLEEAESELESELEPESELESDPVSELELSSGTAFKVR